MQYLSSLIFAVISSNTRYCTCVLQCTSTIQVQVHTMVNGECLNLSGTEAGHCDDLEDDRKTTLDNIKLKLNCHSEDEMTAERFKRLNKDVLVGWLVL